MSRLRVAIDMDEVIADAVAAERQWLMAEFGYMWEEAQLSGNHLKNLVAAEHARALEQHLHNGEFFSRLDVIPGSVEAVQQLSRRYDIFVTTAAMEYPGSLAHKHRWLLDNFGFLNPLNFVFCGDKSIINAAFLIDDNSRHFARFCGQGVLFSAPHNVGIHGYPRLNSWAEAEALLGELEAFLTP
jgi:5'(3')-deoxyribonucleotidase